MDESGEGCYARRDVELNHACGITWDENDILRFLKKTKYDPFTQCLIWTGARSRGRGNTAWYGSYRVKGKTVRAHKFYAIAILNLRPQLHGVDHLDHKCQNSLCVRHLQCVPAMENLRLRWARVSREYGC